MTKKPIVDRPSAGFERELDAFYTALDQTAPTSLTGCLGWTMHELTAHICAAAIEIAENLEAFLAGKVVPNTRSFEEREAPYRAMTDSVLRVKSIRSIERMAADIDSVLSAEPDAVVPWTGRAMLVKTFVTHLRSELAIHRYDIVGDDETSRALLGNSELTDHAVTILGRALLFRGSNMAPTGFRAALSSPDSDDVIVLVDDEDSCLIRGEISSNPAVIGDADARLLFLWGRLPGNPSRLKALGGPEVLAHLQSLLAGY